MAQHVGHSIRCCHSHINSHLYIQSGWNERNIQKLYFQVRIEVDTESLWNFVAAILPNDPASNSIKPTISKKLTFDSTEAKIIVFQNYMAIEMKAFYK